MDASAAALSELIDANARWLGLAIEPEWRALILESLVAIVAAIEAVEAFPLPDAAEPAPVFAA
jgi:hypothetical protein